MTALTLEAIETAIADLVAKQAWDYKNGNFSMERSEQMNSLIKLRESMLANPEADLEIMSFDFDIDIFGTDRTQVEP